MLILQLIKEMQSAPTEIDLMKDTIYTLTNSSAPLEEVLLALEVLQSLVEPIDNANGKHTCPHAHVAAVGCQACLRCPCKLSLMHAELAVQMYSTHT